MKTATINIEQFLSGYQGCALWSTQDYRDENDEQGYTLEDEFSEFSDACTKAMREDCEDFISSNLATLEAFKTAAGCDDWRLGFLFWLNREGHGSGFWDELSGDDAALGDALSDACKPYGDFCLYGDFDKGVVCSHHYG